MKLQLRPTVKHTRQNRSRLHNNLPLPFLGRGAYGSVDVVQQCYTGQVFARKRSRTTSFHREVEITKRLKHPHIIQFVAAYTQNSSLNLIISPVAESTLRDYLDFPGDQKESESQIHRWVGCLSSALSYIHASRIRHADIKPQNILLRDSEVFISDFGISRLVSEPDSTSSSNSPMTPLYAAMEIAEHLPHGRNADVFSLGCVFAEMLT
ncbi:kinase-like domain-containing protein, partial [Cenococcum geophilum]